MSGKSHGYRPAASTLATAMLAAFTVISPQAQHMLAHNAVGVDLATGMQEDMHPWTIQTPWALKARATKDPDLPSLREGLAGPYRDEFWKAMELEISGLEGMGTWEIVSRASMPGGAKAIPGTWALRIKRYPDGRLNKFKARWCVMGNRMEKGVHYFEDSYSPLVGWPTVRAAMLLSAADGWISRQVDFTNAFCQATQKDLIYVELPQYYKPKGLEDQDVVLKLNKSLYGQVTAPKLFWEHLQKGMTELGFEQAKSDPCLFIHKKLKLMVLNYCDDQIWLSPDNALIEEYVGKLKALGYDLTLEKEGDMFAFLGIDIRRVGTQIELMQKGLIEKVIKYLGLQDAKPKSTPASTHPLGSDKDGDPFTESWSYPAAVGMLLYLSSNTRPDIQFAVHQVARFSHDPRQSHAQAIKRIARYLLSSKDKGILFEPDLKAGLDCYVDADFAGLYGYEDEQDPVSVKSRTGFVLTLFGCPIIWSSKLQTDITLSSTAAEYVAFSMAMRELLPMRALLQELGDKLELEFTQGSLVRSTVFEDNQGCLSMVNSPKMSSRNKYLSLKYHFFRSHIGKDKGIEAKWIETTKQKADIFTKGLPESQFQVIRKLLIGW
jgi:Reverse transcriptase (RNA-dependent DNA polymerase)